MNEEVKQVWLEALESGRYEQGQAELRQRNRYCCLGVLCDIAKEHGIGDWADDNAFQCSLDDSDYSYLPDAVETWAGLDRSYQIELSVRNDAGQSFMKIADVVRGL